MYELENGSKRLVTALKAVQGDDYIIRRIADYLQYRPEQLKEDLKLDYVAFSIPNDFILGYGLDYDQQGRGLKDLYTLVTE